MASNYNSQSDAVFLFRFSLLIAPLNLNLNAVIVRAERRWYKNSRDATNGPNLS